ncbi:to BRCA1 gene 1 isoform X2 [Podarcis lilfordi]|uniref:To BRCA1 gene 1 isoform X2 n=1 Tax=Podarcis lilfordi TaxID=74358 RepID=A0AA35L4P6_9SAUR|nr:to BRCA1 gene 1 isoform X2 [Podarcis lilfordi]
MVPRPFPCPPTPPTQAAQWNEESGVSGARRRPITSRQPLLRGPQPRVEPPCFFPTSQRGAGARRCEEKGPPERWLPRQLRAGAAPRGPGGATSCGMDPQVNLSVTFQGDTQSFLVSDSSNTTWADVEAMVKVSFELNDIQIKYLDEDQDEVSVNTAEEYEEALKIAVKQGNRLQMNVYQISAPLGMPTQQAPEKAEKTQSPKDGRKPLAHYSMLARTLAQDRDTGRENEKRQSEQHPSEAPPEWFTSYLERFREQVVQETVEMLEQKLSEKLLLSGQLPSSLSSATPHAPASPSVQGNPFDWLLSCSNCQASIVGIRYQCSVCPSYSICESCETGTYAHDPNHVLLKLRKPVLCISETYNLGQFTPRFATLEQARLQKQMDKRFLKAEKQRLRAEKKQRKAEVRELKKQLKLHRKIHLWNSVHALENAGLTAAKSESLQPNTLLPLQGCPVIVPTLSAAFVDENLPDGTRLHPRTTFIKHWRMRNTGNMEWSSDTKERPSKFKGQTLQTADGATTGGVAGRAAPPKLKSILSAREFYIPSVDLLTAQDLLSFELLDINIVQELEQVPHNTPGDAQAGKGKAENLANSEEGEEDMSGTQFVCETVIRSLTLDAAPDHRPPQRKESLQSSLQALQDNAHCSPNKDPVRIENVPSPTLQEPESKNQGIEVAQEPEFEELLLQDGAELSDGETEDDAKDEVCSEASSTSSEDYIIILPECFDTSRPLGESMYSSALSQPSLEKVAEASASPAGENQPSAHSINDMLTTSQTLDEVPLTPQILEPQPARSLAPPQNSSSQETSVPSGEDTSWWVPDQTREVVQGADVPEPPPAGNVNSTPTCPEFSRHTHGNSLAGDLVKGALSVAASAYKALFAGPPTVEQALPVATEEQMNPFLANLSEMGFCDRHLNLRLLRKHNCDMSQVVTELLQLSHSDWYENQY